MTRKPDYYSVGSFLDEPGKYYEDEVYLDEPRQFFKEEPQKALYEGVEPPVPERAPYYGSVPPLPTPAAVSEFSTSDGFEKAALQQGIAGIRQALLKGEINKGDHDALYGQMAPHLTALEAKEQATIEKKQFEQQQQMMRNAAFMKGLEGQDAVVDANNFYDTIRSVANPMTGEIISGYIRDKEFVPFEFGGKSDMSQSGSGPLDYFPATQGMEVGQTKGPSPYTMNVNMGDQQYQARFGQEGGQWQQTGQQRYNRETGRWEDMPIGSAMGAMPQQQQSPVSLITPNEIQEITRTANMMIRLPPGPERDKAVNNLIVDMAQKVQNNRLAAAEHTRQEQARSTEAQRKEQAEARAKDEKAKADKSAKEEAAKNKQRELYSSYYDKEATHVHQFITDFLRDPTRKYSDLPPEYQDEDKKRELIEQRTMGRLKTVHPDVASDIAKEKMEHKMAEEKAKDKAIGTEIGMKFQASTMSAPRNRDGSLNLQGMSDDQLLELRTHLQFPKDIGMKPDNAKALSELILKEVQERKARKVKAPTTGAGVSGLISTEGLGQGVMQGFGGT